MGRVRILVLAAGVLAGAGCRQIFGIDDTDLAGPDAPALDAAAPDAARNPGPDAFVFSTDQCPDSYLPQTAGAMSRYRVIPNSRSIKNHHEDCKNDAPGLTHLVVLDSVPEIQDVTLLGPTLKFVGLVQVPEADEPAESWFSVTGEPYALPWGPGEPNDQDKIENGSENVAELGPTEGLNDTSNDNLPAICECDGRAVSPVIDALIGANRLGANGFAVRR